MEWFGFWIFMATVWVVDGWLYSQGHTGLIFTHKTDAEKALRDRQAGITPSPDNGRIRDGNTHWSQS